MTIAPTFLLENIFYFFLSLKGLHQRFELNFSLDFHISTNSNI